MSSRILYYNLFFHWPEDLWYSFDPIITLRILWMIVFEGLQEQSRFRHSSFPNISIVRFSSYKDPWICYDSKFIAFEICYSQMLKKERYYRVKKNLVPSLFYKQLH